MANENCLQGFRCPSCESEGPFKIEARVLVTVYDDGTDDSESDAVEWNSHSYCECCECHRYGTVGSFTNRKGDADARLESDAEKGHEA